MQTQSHKRAQRRSPGRAAPVEDTPRQELVLARLKGRKSRSATIGDLAAGTGLEERQVRAAIDRLRRAGHKIPRTDLCTVTLQR